MNTVRIMVMIISIFPLISVGGTGDALCLDSSPIKDNNDLLTDREINNAEPVNINKIDNDAMLSDTLALTIDESIQLALEHNRNLEIARERLAEAGEAVGEAGTAFLPKLTGEMNYTRLDMAPFFPTKAFAEFGGGGVPSTDGEEMPKKIEIGLPNNYSASLNLQQPVFTAGKLKRSYQISLHAKNSAKNELERALNELIFTVKQRYWNLVKARLSHRLAEESVKLLQSQLSDLKNMYEVGMAARVDLLKTRALYSEAKLNLIKADNMKRLAEKNFCNTVGLKLSTPIKPISEPSDEPVEGISLPLSIRKSMVNRPELEAFNQQRMIAEKQLEINQRGYLPDIFFAANLGYNYPDREYNSQFYTTWTMGLFASVNIFDWGAVAHKCEQARSRLKQAKLARRDTEEVIRLDVTAAYLTLEESGRAIETAHEAKQQADENYRVTQEKFKEGLVSNTELLDAHTLLIRARNSYHSTVIDYTIAEANLKRATGELVKGNNRYIED
jgi:outer membrane protein